MRSIGRWVADELESRGWSYSEFQRKSGIDKSTTERIINTDFCTLDKFKKLVAAMGTPPADVEYEPRSKGWSKRKISTPLMIALQRMQESSADDRDQALTEVMRAITPRKPAFMAVMTMTVMPSTFTKRYDLIKREMMGAHDRGMMTLYIVPDEWKVGQLSRECGFEHIPSAEDYVKGFAAFQSEYREHLRTLGEPEYLADARMMLLPSRHLDATAWLYIITLIGETISAGTIEYRIAERGPANKGVISVIPWHSRHDSEMLTYIRTILQRAFPKGDNKFASEFLERTRTD